MLTPRLPPATAARRAAGFEAALVADGPAADRADAMALYGWLVGDWTMRSVLHAPDGTSEPGPDGEIHAAWALEGRAVQDVWILPGFFYGTTLRIYDPGLGAWHILWNDPVKAYFTRQLGRGEGDRIVQTGREDDGTLVRWSFSEIAKDGFRWLAERLGDDGATWCPHMEFFAQRVRGSRSDAEPPGGAR